MKKILVLAVFLAFSSQPIVADLLFQPPSTNTTVGSSFNVDVMISGITSPWLGAYDFTVQYDPAILDATTLIWNSTYMGSALPDLAFPASNEVRFSVVSLEATADLGPLQTGHDPFLLGQIYFNAIGPGTSSLHFLDVILGDGNGDPITMAALDGSVTVTGGTPIPEPSTYLLLLVPAGLAALKLRRA